MNGKEWFKEAKYGMMIHWGLYSILAGEWKGQRMGGIGEWIQQYYRIPIAEYEKLTKVFNPIYFDAGLRHEIYGGNRQAPRGLLHVSHQSRPL